MTWIIPIEAFHKIQIDPKFKQVRQRPRKMAMDRVNKEAGCLLKVGFIKLVKYLKWISNIVVVLKKNR